MKCMAPVMLLWSTFVLSVAGIRVEELWTFPVGTWVENLAVRSNGQILTTFITAPEVYQVDPSKKNPPALVATIPNRSATFGITETKDDQFFVAAGNYSIETGKLTPKTMGVWRIDVSKFKPGRTVTPSLVAKFDASTLLNGMGTINADKGILAVAESLPGAVWRLNVQTGKKGKIEEGSITAAGKSIGPNGVHVEDGNLFFDNTDQETLYRVPITSRGHPSGSPVNVLANLASPDDFALAPFGHAKGARGYIAGNNQLRSFVDGKVEVVSNNALLNGSTSCQYLKPGVAYVSTSGNDAQYGTPHITSPGKVVAVYLID